MIDILNRSERFYTKMAPIFIALVAFCFSMTIGVLWEFFEFGMDTLTNTDMQKDRIVRTISSIKLNDEGKNEPNVIKNIKKTIIYTEDNQEFVINDGYLDIGIRDTMKDLLVNLIGATTFSAIGFLYIKNRKDYKFTEKFIPVRKK